MVDSENMEKTISGISASPGICIGKAYLVGKEGVDVVDKYFISKNNLQNEIKRFKSAVKHAKDKLQEIIETTPEELRQHIHILETHKVLYKDKMLYGKTIETIEQNLVNAEWALKNVVSNVKNMFRKMPDPYLQGRMADIVHVSESIMQNLVGAKTLDIGAIGKRVILVAVDLSPAETSQIQLEKIKGLITDLGGKTSHTGIIARTQPGKDCQQNGIRKSDHGQTEPDHKTDDACFKQPCPDISPQLGIKPETPDECPTGGIYPGKAA